jgi:phosphate transport system protein
MRNLYAEQLHSIDEGLVDMTRHVQQAVNRATHALLTADPHVADQVIAGDAQIDLFRDRIEDRVFEVLALQQPVAGDLRMLMAAVRMVADLERMGDLAVHVAKIARMRLPEVAVPEQLMPTVWRMAEVAGRAGTSGSSARARCGRPSRDPLPPRCSRPAHSRPCSR